MQTQAGGWINNVRPRGEQRRVEWYFHLAHMHAPRGKTRANLITCHTDAVFILTQQVVHRAVGGMKRINFCIRTDRRWWRWSLRPNRGTRARCDEAINPQRSEIQGNTPVHNFALQHQREFFCELYFWRGTHRGNLQDSSSIVELHGGRVHRAQTCRVQVLPDQGPFKTLDTEKHSYPVNLSNILYLYTCMVSVEALLGSWGVFFFLCLENL